MNRLDSPKHATAVLFPRDRNNLSVLATDTEKETKWKVKKMKKTEKMRKNEKMLKYIRKIGKFTPKGEIASG